MLEQPQGSYAFARYHYRAPQEVTMGYEYENKYHMVRGYTQRDQEQRSKVTTDTLALLPNYFQAQYEGFVNSSGVEIKSVVAPLFLHKQFWNRYVSKIPFDMTANSQTNDSGIHVSISKTTFTDQQKDKVFTFLHTKANRPAFLRLSKRTQRSLDQNAPSNPRGNPRRLWNERLRCSENQWPDTPEWLDYYNTTTTENTNRFEFRLFA